MLPTMPRLPHGLGAKVLSVICIQWHALAWHGMSLADSEDSGPPGPFAIHGSTINLMGSTSAQCYHVRQGSESQMIHSRHAAPNYDDYKVSDCWVFKTGDAMEPG
jgi:hypothetical protein